MQRGQRLRLKDRAIEEAKDYKDPQDTQLWKSIFRVSHDRSDPRNRSLAILSNVFLHLHPAKINRDAVRYPFTWGMGGITFYLFIVLTFTGVLLDVLLPPDESRRFQRHSLSRARRAVRQAAAQHASLGGALDGDHDLAAHVSRRADRILQKAARIQLVRRRGAAGADAAAFVYRLPAAGRSARFLGGDGGNEHGARDADAGSRRTVWRRNSE